MVRFGTGGIVSHACRKRGGRRLSFRARGRRGRWILPVSSRPQGSMRRREKGEGTEGPRAPRKERVDGRESRIQERWVRRVRLVLFQRSARSFPRSLVGKRRSPVSIVPRPRVASRRRPFGSNRTERFRRERDLLVLEDALAFLRIAFLCFSVDEWRSIPALARGGRRRTVSWRGTWWREKELGERARGMDPGGSIHVDGVPHVLLYVTGFDTASTSNGIHALFFLDRVSERSCS